MRTSDTLRLAFAGTRADRARVSITAFGAAVAVLVLLCSATVLAVPPDSGRYTNRMLNSGTLLTNLAVTMMLFSVPVMFFVAQCARLGAPGRNRRLAAFRLAGASPAQVGRIAGVETGVAATIGTAAGALVYFVGRLLLDGPRPDGRRLLPTDVLPTPTVLAVLLLGVPLLATLLTVVLLRRVAITPFGVVRRTGRQRVRAWPGLLGVAGLLGLSGLEAAIRSEFLGAGRLGTAEFPLLVGWAISCTVLLMLGLTLGTAWIGHVGARLLLRLTRRPSALIAARQTLADPYDGSRSYSVILVTTAFGGAAMMLHSWLVTDVAVRTAAEAERVRRFGGRAMDLTGTAAFRSDVFELVNTVLLALICVTALTLLVALVESGVARRRTLAALVAAGTPRTVLARALCWRVLIPAVPGIAAAGLAGMLAMRSFTSTATAGYSSDACLDTVERCNDPTVAAEWAARQFELVFPVPVPWAEVAAVGSTALLAVLLVIGASILLQRSSVNPAELRAD